MRTSIIHKTLCPKPGVNCIMVSLDCFMIQWSNVPLVDLNGSHTWSILKVTLGMFVLHRVAVAVVGLRSIGVAIVGLEGIWPASGFTIDLRWGLRMGPIIHDARQKHTFSAKIRESYGFGHGCVFFVVIFDGPDIWPQWCNDAIIEREGEAGCEGKIIISMKGMKSYKSLKLKQHFSVDRNSTKISTFRHGSMNQVHGKTLHLFKPWKRFQIASIHSPLPSSLWHERPLRRAIAPALILCKATIGSSIASAMKNHQDKRFHPSHRPGNKAAKRKTW